MFIYTIGNIGNLFDAIPYYGDVNGKSQVRCSEKLVEYLTQNRNSHKVQFEKLDYQHYTIHSNNKQIHCEYSREKNNIKNCLTHSNLL